MGERKESQVCFLITVHFFLQKREQKIKYPLKKKKTSCVSLISRCIVNVAEGKITERTGSNTPSVQKAKQTSWVPSGFLCVQKPSPFWFLGYQPSRIASAATVSRGTGLQNNVGHVSLLCSRGSTAWTRYSGAGV